MGYSSIFVSPTYYRTLEDLFKTSKGQKKMATKIMITAQEAKQKSEEALERQKIQNRDHIFTSIRNAAQTGHKSTNIDVSYFNNGNDIFFEGLGYEITEIPQTTPTNNTMTGVIHFIDPPIPQNTWIQYRYMKISWE